MRSVFRMALRRPELLGLVREVSRLGPPAATRVAANLEPLVGRARGFLAAEMDAGRMRRSDPALVLVSAYSTVLGVATEVEVLRAVGIEPTLRATVGRRRELLAFLRSALVVPDCHHLPLAPLLLLPPSRTGGVSVPVGARFTYQSAERAGERAEGGGRVGQAAGTATRRASMRPARSLSVRAGFDDGEVQTYNVCPSDPPRAQA